MSKVLSFGISGRLCGFSTDEVKEVLPLPILSPVGGMPTFILGSFVLDEKPVLALGLDTILGLPRFPISVYSPMIRLKAFPWVLVVQTVETIIDFDQWEKQETKPENSLNGVVRSIASKGTQSLSLLTPSKLLLEVERKLVEECQATLQSRFNTKIK